MPGIGFRKPSYDSVSVCVKEKYCAEVLFTCISCAMVAVYVAKRCGYSCEQACCTRMTTRRASYVQMLPREASAKVDVEEDLPLKLDL